MSTPREFWLKVHKCDPAFDVFESEVSQTKPDFAKMMWHDFKDSIHVIEKTPEVVRKLECFDEMTKALNWLMEKMPNYCIDKYDKEAPPIKSVAYWSDLEKLLKKAKGE
jgi:hypothetical protein